MAESTQANTDTTAFEDEALAAIDSVYRFARQLTRDPWDTEDLVQETFLRAYEHRDQYRLGTNCRAWLFTICRNLWIQRRQRDRRVTPCPQADLADLIHVGQTAEPYRTFDLPEFADVVIAALAELPETFRTPVVLIDAEDHSYATASEILNVPIGTIRSRLYRGRRLLQARLRAYAEDAGLIPRSSASPRVIAHTDSGDGVSLHREVVRC